MGHRPSLGTEFAYVPVLNRIFQSYIGKFIHGYLFEKMKRTQEADHDRYFEKHMQVEAVQSVLGVIEFGILPNVCLPTYFSSSIRLT